jgi:hypothetical protein
MRRFYTTGVRFFPGSDTTTTIAWFPAQSDLGVPANSFMAVGWERGLPDGLGELPATRHQRGTAAEYFIVPPAGLCGSEGEWLNGAGSVGSIDPDTNLPVCCGRGDLFPHVATLWDAIDVVPGVMQAFGGDLDDGAAAFIVQSVMPSLGGDLDDGGASFWLQHPMAVAGGDLDDGGGTFGFTPGGFVFTTQTDQTGSRAIGTVYQNSGTDPMLVAITTQASNVGTDYCNIYTDSNNPPTTLVGQTYQAAAFGEYSCTVVVLPGNYIKITQMGGTTSLIAWIEWT